MNKIFVSIASYRDKQLVPTIKDLLEKSSYPENLNFGICWQHDKEENDLYEYKNDKRFKIIDIDYTKSLGACWARSEVQSLYENQDYYFQLDSHHRFVDAWDEKLINMLLSLEKVSKKPIITAYCSVLDINKCNNLKNEPLKIVGYEEFSSDGNLMLKPHFIENHEKIKSPIPARFISGHFIFTRGNWIKECPYDPNLYFHGEEVSLSIRSFTNGYDLYHPDYTICWHEYIRAGNKKHWDDHKSDDNLSWWKLDQKAKKRLRKLLMQEDNEENLERYNIGNKRSFHDYELYTGIDFRNKKVGARAKRGEDPFILTEEEWEKEINSEKKTYNLSIEWNLSEIDNCDDCDFWFFGIETLNGTLLHRSDFNQDNNKQILNKEINKTKVSFQASDNPHHFVIWPHSKSNGWLTKYTKNI